MSRVLVGLFVCSILLILLRLILWARSRRCTRTSGKHDWPTNWVHRAPQIGVPGYDYRSCAYCHRTQQRRWL